MSRELGLRAGLFYFEDSSCLCSESTTSLRGVARVLGLALPGRLSESVGPKGIELRAPYIFGGARRPGG